jgi:hypothetical protein
MQFPDGRILIFAKAPIAGQVKTRLIPLLGAERAARLQGELTERAVRIAVTSQCAPVELWCAPDATAPIFSQLAARYDVSLHVQCQGDLGARMEYAFRTAFNTARTVVIVGTDWPELSTVRIHQAFARLADGNDAVITPAEDGGYVMLGLRQHEPRLFTEMPWSSAAVYSETRRRFATLQLRSHSEAMSWDLDRPDDWRRALREGLLSEPEPF